ncbi:MAG: hypothetical protein KDA93_10745 [Planctomycetaceae bacterium]|nr:hypothetical protein [Planctomycetaceae bacterium]
MQDLTVNRFSGRHASHVTLGLVMCLPLVMCSDTAQLRVLGDEPQNPRVQEPFAVVGYASIDRLLEDLDVLSDTVGQPNYAKFVRGFLSGQNDLRGFDRCRPLGAMLSFQGDDADDVRPTFFFPTTEINELIKTVRFGDSLELKHSDDRSDLVLKTDRRDLPVQLEHDYALLRVHSSSDVSELHSPDPALILGDVVQSHDLFALLRREGIPQSVFDRAHRELEEDTEKDLTRKDDESDQEYEIRCEVSRGVHGLIESVLNEWRSLSAGVTFERDSRVLHLAVDVAMEPEGDIQKLLTELTRAESRFGPMVDQPAPLTVATTFSLPEPARDIIHRLIQSARAPLESEIVDADEGIRNAFSQLFDAAEGTVSAGVVDAYGQLVPTSEGHFVLTGGISIVGADDVANGMQAVLPFVTESESIRDVELNVANLHGVAVHRLYPAKLRRHDRRLYGEEATIYLAAGDGVFWVALGGEQTLSELEAVIESVAAISSESDSTSAATVSDATEADSHPLLNVAVNLSQWKDFAMSQEGQRSQRLAGLLGDAFPDASDDEARFTVNVTPDGLNMQANFGTGYSRMFGLAIARRLNRGDR